MPKRASLEERFWEKVDQQGPVLREDLGPCWVWKGAITRGGYGHLGIGSRGRQIDIQSHRFSWEMRYGVIPATQWVLHRCDNRRCVKPEHLFLGDARVNSRDCRAKGRNNIGERNGSARLTETAVKQIRMRRATREVFARTYGVSESAIRLVQRGLTWRHVLRPDPVATA